MKEYGICAKCKKSVGCSYADERIMGCRNFVLEPELQLINEEWLRQANTEELAEWMVMLQLVGVYPIKRGSVDTEMFIADTVEWLKKPHTTE